MPTLDIGGAEAAVGAHAADHHSRGGGASVRGQVGVADGAREAVGVEVEVQSRDGDERLGTHWLVAEGAGEVGVRRPYQERLLQTVLSLVVRQSQSRPAPAAGLAEELFPLPRSPRLTASLGLVAAHLASLSDNLGEAVVARSSIVLAAGDVGGVWQAPHRGTGRSTHSSLLGKLPPLGPCT